MKKHFWKNKNAEVMVEASLILSVAVIVVFMLFYLGFIMYHQTLITSVANQTASNIAQAYGNQYKDPVSGYVDVSNLDREGIVNKMKNQAYGEVIAKKAEWFSKYRMAKGEFLNSEDPVKVDVRIENKHGALLRAQIVVDVEASYDLPFVKFFGIGDSVLTYHSTGRADCYEIMDYVNIVEAADKIDVTENFQVTFHNKDQIHKVVEVMHDMSIAETCKLSAAQQTRFPADPTWSGERFYRWKMANGQTFTKDTVVTGNIDVYAEYDCRVIFVGYDGHTQFAMRYAHRNQRFQNGGESLPAGPGESGDNKFYCWWYNNAPFTADTVVPDRDTITVTIRKYLWVKFDANGGSVNESRRFVAPGAALGALPSATRQYYAFDGWFTSGNGGTQYTASSRINSSMTLYAHWHCTHPGDHRRREWVARDCTREEYNDYCTVCGAHMNHYYHPGEHDWEYCNRTHNIDPYEISSHAGLGSSYKESTLGRCIVCAKCHARRNGYWCVQHRKMNGAIVADNWWKNNGFEVQYH